jgi:hypothetical protein
MIPRPGGRAEPAEIGGCCVSMEWYCIGISIGIGILLVWYGIIMVLVCYGMVW